MKQKPPTPIYHTMGKPKWISSVEKKHNVTITIHWFDKLRWSVENSFKEILVSLLISYLKTNIGDSVENIKDYIVGILLRWVLKIGGTWLASIGVSEGDIASIIGGIVAVIVGVIISLFQQKKAVNAEPPR